MIHNTLIHSNENRSNNTYTAAQMVRSTILGNNTVTAAVSENEPYKRHLYDLLKTVSDHLPDNRVSTCQKFPVMFKDSSGKLLESASVSVGVAENGCCKFGGLNYCGSIWLCPVCARTVAPQRIAEIKHAMGENAKRGGQSLFVTFTQPHYLDNPLADLIAIQTKALSKMKATREYKALTSKYGFIGEIRAFELLHGVNGWHPHIHAVYFFENITVNKDIQIFEDKLYAMWAKWIVKSGGQKPSKQYGLDVRLPRKGDTDEIASYMGKWGEELTLSHTKESKTGSLTPFQLIEMLHQEYTYDTYALVKEFAKATYRKRRIHWSPKLKELFDIEEFTDQEAAQRPAKTHLFDIKWVDYKILRKVGLAGDVLDLSQKYPVDFVSQFIDSVCFLYNQYIEKERQEYSEARKRIQAMSRSSVRSELFLLGHYR